MEEAQFITPKNGNGSGQVVETEEDRIKDLEAKLHQSEINRLLERRNALLGWGAANQLQMMDTERQLRELGWKP